MFPDDAEAIRVAQSVQGVDRIEKYPGDFTWQVVMWCSARLKHCPKVTGREAPAAFPIRVVCYCRVSARPEGWFIEVDLRRKTALAISGKLAHAYGFDGPSLSGGPSV